MSYRQVQHSFDLEVAMFCFGLVGNAVAVLVVFFCFCFAFMNFMREFAREGIDSCWFPRFTYPVMFANEQWMINARWTMDYILHSIIPLSLCKTQKHLLKIAQRHEPIKLPVLFYRICSRSTLIKVVISIGTTYVLLEVPKIKRLL
jgi:hypothetical protein